MDNHISKMGYSVEKNILIVTDVAPPQVNGVLRTLQNTSRVLESRGNKVTFLSPLNFKSVPMPFYQEIMLSLPPYGMKKKIQGYDAVHISTEGPLGLAARMAANRLGIAYTTAYHTNFPMYLERYWKIPQAYTYRYMKWFHKNSHAVMVPTPSMMKILEEKGFKNVVHWGRGVDNTIFYPRDVEDIEVGPRPYFVNVGRVSAEKNLEAFLSLDLPGTKIIIGDGPAMPSLKKQFPNTVFLGAKKGIELADWYNRADVFVFPSLSDTFGLVIAEAIACGCPVAAFPVAGPIDIIEHGLTGYIHEDLERAACEAMFLPRMTCDFSWEVATDQFYDNLCFN